MSEQISITRALKEVSVLDKRISTAVSTLKMLDITQGKFKGKALRSNQPIDEFVATTKSAYESLNDLVKRRGNIKKAIVLSNASTAVTVGKSEYSVAEAIERKTSISIKKNMLKMFKSQKHVVDGELERSRSELSLNLDRFIEQNLGKDRKTNKDDFDNIAQPYIEANELKVVDPLGLTDLIKGLETEIEDFESDVDIALSESNAKTLINI